MRICIAYSSTNNNKIEDYARSLVKGIHEQMDCIIDLIDIDKNPDKKLTGYKYLIFGAAKKSMFNSNVDSSVKYFIKNCGQISGKKSFAFTASGFTAHKFLKELMKDLEKEGVFMKNSSPISSNEEALRIGQKLNIK